MKPKHILIIAAAGALMASCARNNADSRDEGQLSAATITIDIADMQKPSVTRAGNGDGLVVTSVDAPSTRSEADGTDAERTVENLWVLQYKGTGDDGVLWVSELIETAWLPGSETDTRKIDIKLRKTVSSTIVVIANVGNDLYNHYFNTLGELRTEMLAIDASNGFTGAIPMAGVYEGAVGTGETIGVELQRLVAKLTFTLDFTGLPATSELKLTSAQLQNVSTGTAFLPQNDEFPTATPSNFVFYPMVNSTEGFTTGHVLEWYAPENNRGTNPLVTNEKDKWAQTDPSYAMDVSYATRLVLKGTYKTAERPTLREITITVYPGKNATDDFNVERNGLHSMRLRLSAIDESTDKRIVIRNPPNR